MTHDELKDLLSVNELLIVWRMFIDKLREGRHMATFSFVFIILLELLFLDGNRISSHQVTRCVFNCGNSRKG